MDTICVPLEPKTRSAAIIAMRKTYREADRVLVLDSVLSQVPISCGPTELIMRIRASTWVRRLWTFQEAGLAKTIFYQFQDYACTAKDISEMRGADQWIQDEEHEKSAIYARWKLRRSCTASIQEISDVSQFGNDLLLERFYMPDLDVVFREGMSFLWDLEDFTAWPFDTEQERFISLVAAICWRWTSKLADEAICLAGILDRNVSELLKAPASLRLKDLLLSLDQLPPAILFSDVERVQAESSRWAPVSLLGGGFDARILPSPRHAHATSDGLLVTLPGILFTERIIGAAFAFLFFQNDQFYFVREARRQTISWEEYRHTEMAIVLERSLLENYSSLKGVLVSVKSRDSGTLVARYERLVRVSPRGIEGRLEDAATSSQALEDTQSWCIG